MPDTSTRNALALPLSSDLGNIFYTGLHTSLETIDAAIAKCNWAAATDPGVGDDSADGYVVGSWWWNTTAHRLWQAESVGAGAAVWRQIWPVASAPGAFSVGGAIDIYGAVVVDSNSGLTANMKSFYNIAYSGMVFGHTTLGNVALALGGCMRQYADTPAGMLTFHSLEADQSLYDSCGASVEGIPDDTNTAHVGMHLIFKTRASGSARSAKLWLFGSGGASLGSSTDPGVNNLYVQGDVNCASVTDHTDFFKGDALKEIAKIKGTSNGKIDHNTLPKFARSKYRKPIFEKRMIDEPIQGPNGKAPRDNNGKIITRKIEKECSDRWEEADGRNIGNMISVITTGMQQLIDLVEKQGAEIEKLKAKKA